MPSTVAGKTPFAVGEGEVVGEDVELGAAEAGGAIDAAGDAVGGLGCDAQPTIPALRTIARTTRTRIDSTNIKSGRKARLVHPTCTGSRARIEPSN